jgi:hypothetical protein
MISGAAIDKPLPAQFHKWPPLHFSKFSAHTPLLYLDPKAGFSTPIQRYQSI